MSSDDASSIDQLKKYAEDISKVYKAEKEKRKEIEIANRQIVEYAEALNKTISRVKSKNEKLNALALELSNIEERERSRIAEDLHDNIGQMLAMAKVKLQELSKSVVDIDAERLDEIDRLIQKAISFSRSMTFEISPNALIELGFVEAVEWLVEHIHKKYGLDIKYSHCEQANPLDGNISIILFKAVSELLINTVKHARTNKAKVTVANFRNGVRIIVQDNGSGFDPSKMHRDRAGEMKFGLFNLQQRIINAGGSIDIDSKAGMGTLVVITVPQKTPISAREQLK